MQWIYLDNNATTQPAPQVVAAVAQMLQECWANPSSMHRLGQMVRQKVELARASVAALLGCKDRELVFTSGGTESNNLALRGLLLRPADPAASRPQVLLTNKVEHAAVREVAADLAEMGVLVVYLPVDGAGRVLPQALQEALAEHAGPDHLCLVSVQWANNETGVIQDVAALADVVRQFRQETRARLFLHVDATQAVGKISVNLQKTMVDLLTFSGHKFHGPKGVGGLFIRSGVRLRPQVRGGPQERQRRGGTENTAAIVGLGVAAELAGEFLNQGERIAQLAGLRDRLEQGLIAALPDTVINGTLPGQQVQRLWNTSNLGFPHLEAEALLLGLSEKGLCASAGAACSSGSLEPSPVLLAMGVPEAVAHGSLRFSLSRLTTAAEIEQALVIVPQVVRKLARSMPQAVD